MNVALVLLLGALIPAWAIALATKHGDDAMHPIRWWLVIVTGEFLGAALTVGVAQ